MSVKLIFVFKTKECIFLCKDIAEQILHNIPFFRNYNWLTPESIRVLILSGSQRLSCHLHFILTVISPLFPVFFYAEYASRSFLAPSSI